MAHGIKVFGILADGMMENGWEDFSKEDLTSIFLYMKMNRQKHG